jgi:hypothetical protein
VNHVGSLCEGVFLAPSQFEAMFVSYARTKSDIEETFDKFFPTPLDKPKKIFYILCHHEFWQQNIIL